MSGFDPTAVLRTLEAHRVDHVLIGGVAAALHGSPLATGDIDICPRRDEDNLIRLAAALEAVGAAIDAGGTDTVPLPPDPALLAQAATWNLVTDHGRVDISFEPSGTTGYHDLRRDAVVFELDDLTVWVASLADIIRSKEAAGRERDRQALPTLRRLLEVIDDSPG